MSFSYSAVLVAIAIPIFTAQLEKSRESTDVANIRDYYAEISVGLLDGSLNSTSTTTTVTGGKTATATYTNGVLTSVAIPSVAIKQTDFSKWSIGNPDIAGVTVTTVPASASVKVTYSFTEDTTSGKIYLSGIAFE
ncbi:MAG: hypothetical protein IJU75_00085 [Clostridia bacterium]|nr:hypothetical protein [Clostridia bacterium]